jgi:sugar-specific transcriptional regulator TrmB
VKSDKNTAKNMLLQLGFDEHEAVVYLALLELEAVSIRKVAEATGINRGTTYEVIKRLVGQGLVTVRTSGKREYYSAESPEKIYDIIRDMRKDLLQTQKIAADIVPKLLVRSARPQGSPLVKYYEDDDGIVTILKDVLQTCRKLNHPEYYAYSSQPLRQYLYRKFPTFTNKRIAEDIAVKVIAIGEGGDPAAMSERKWLSEPPKSQASSYTLIYGNKFAQISISKDFTPYGVVIDDVGTAAMQRLLFESLWKNL